jgi:hypothetical protein
MGGSKCCKLKTEFSVLWGDAVYYTETYFMQEFKMFNTSVALQTILKRWTHMHLKIVLCMFVSIYSVYNMHVKSTANMYNVSVNIVINCVEWCTCTIELLLKLICAAHILTVIIM